MQLVESRSLTYSILLHAGLLLVAAFGLPALLPSKTDPTPLVMTVEILPVGEITNVKPSDKPIQEEKHAPTPKTSKPVTPSATEKVKAPTPEEKHFDPMENAEPAPSEKPKPPVDKPKEDKPKQETKKTEDFQALLNKLKQEAVTDKSKTAKDTTNTPANTTHSDAPYDASQPLSMSEKDTIRSQFFVCWSPPVGAKDAQNLGVRVKITLQQDGTVLNAVIASDQMGRYNSDSFYRAAADSALRAVHRCNPIKNLPPEKYGSWKEMELNFDPKDMTF